MASSDPAVAAAAESLTELGQRMADGMRAAAASAAAVVRADPAYQLAVALAQTAARHQEAADAAARRLGQRANALHTRRVLAAARSRRGRPGRPSGSVGPAA